MAIVEKHPNFHVSGICQRLVIVSNSLYPQINIGQTSMNVKFMQYILAHFDVMFLH